MQQQQQKHVKKPIQDASMQLLRGWDRRDRVTLAYKASKDSLCVSDDEVWRTRKTYQNSMAMEPTHVAKMYTPL